eukprot:scaffold205_cov407-Prasinococcus_capsulatus_cf.AAC.2
MRITASRALVAVMIADDRRPRERPRQLRCRKRARPCRGAACRAPTWRSADSALPGLGRRGSRTPSYKGFGRA